MPGGRPPTDPKGRGELRRIGTILHDVIASDALMDAVEEAAEDEGTLERLRANPGDLLQSKGCRIPSEMSVAFTGQSPWAVRLSVTHESGIRYACEARFEGKQARPETDPRDRRQLKALHRQIRDILASDASIDAFAQAASDEGAFAEYMASPKEHLKRKGIRIPDEVDLRVTKESPCCEWYWVYWGWFAWLWLRCD